MAKINKRGAISVSFQVSPLNLRAVVFYITSSGGLSVILNAGNFQGACIHILTLSDHFLDPGSFSL